MPAANVRLVVRRFEADSEVQPDAALVTAFAARGDHAAFAELVRRHGPTVLGVCRRVLGDSHDAEDAFQAVFLVLARKAGTVRPPGAVGGWLYGVAARTANKAKVAAARRRRREMIAATAGASRGLGRPDGPPEDAELRGALDAELARLPAALRAAVVLCDLNGRTRAEAAAELGCPEGTVAARVHRARKKLADALARRGLALPAAGLAATLAPEAVSAALARSALAVAAGRAPAAVAALAREVIRAMTTTTHVLAAGVLALVAAGLLAAGTLRPETPAAEPPTARPGEPGVGPGGQPERGGRDAPAWAERDSITLDGWLGGSVAFTPDGKAFVVGGTDGHARACDAAARKTLWEYKGDGSFTPVAVAPDGKTVAAGYKDGVRLLDAATGKPGGKIEEKGCEPLAAAFFPDTPVPGGTELPLVNRRLILGSARGYTVKSWLSLLNVSTISSATVGGDAKPADEYAVPLAVSPDGKRVVVTGPLDKDTGRNVLWAWSAGSGAGNELLGAHKAVVTAAAWGGNVIVTGDADGLLVTWDGATFKEKSRLALGDRVAAVAVSRDGKLVAAAVVRPAPAPGEGAYAEEVFVWPAAKVPEKPKPISSHVSGAPFRGIASLAFDPDGKTLLSAFCNFDHLTKLGELSGVVRIFTPLAEKPKVEKDRAKPGYVSHVEYAPDGKRYAVVVGGEVKVHDAATDRVVFAVNGEAAGYSADGKTLFVMGEKVLECDPDTGKVRKEHPRPRTKWGWQLVSFSPDGKRYAAHFGMFTAVYDTATGFEPVRLDEQPDGIPGFLTGASGVQLVWSPDGKQVVALGVLVKQGVLGLAGWEVSSGKRFYSLAATDNDWPRAAAFSPDSKAIAIGYKDHIDLWTGGLNPVKKLPTGMAVTALAFSPDGKLIAAGARLPIPNGADRKPEVVGEKTMVLLVSAETGKEVVRFDGFEGVNYMAPTKLPVTTLAFSPDGKKLLAGTGIPLAVTLPKDLPRNGEVKGFDVPAGAEKPAPAAARRWMDAAVLEDHGRLVNGVAVGPDGQTFAAATEGNVTCWDAVTRKVLWKTRGSAFTSLAYSPDGLSIYAATGGGVVRLNAVSGKQEKLFEGRTGVGLENFRAKVKDVPTRAVAVSRDGKRLAGSDGRTTWTVELANPDNHGTYSHGDPAEKDAGPPPAGLAWSPDSKWLAAIHIRHAKRTVPSGVRPEPLWPVRLWGVLARVENRTLYGHTEPVTAVALSKDGAVIATGGADGLVILWDAATEKELWRRKFTGRDDTIGRINALAISPEDNTIAAAVSLMSGKGAERVVLLAAKDGKDVEHIMRPWHVPVASVAWSPDGKFLITGCGAAGGSVKESEPAVGEVVVWERRPEP